MTVITTGSQGEPMAALSRMAVDDHRKIKIVAGDTVILSASAIPGNEDAVYRTINHLFRRGANVFYDGIAPVHVSGHGYAEELKLMLNLVEPQYVMPVHGEYRMLHTVRQDRRGDGLAAGRHHPGRDRRHRRSRRGRGGRHRPRREERRGAD